MSKFVKDLEIREYRKRFGQVGEVLFVNVVGMEATETNKLRLLLRKKGIDLQVVKNNLAAKVLREGGHSGVESALSGPSAVVWGGEDVVSLAREIADWAKKIEKLTIKGGSVGGETLDAKGVDALSKLPSRIELLGQISGTILSPGANIAGALLGPGGTLAGQVKQKAEPADEAADAPAEG
jgi:large subunit ribosomal protein L10